MFDDAVVSRDLAGLRVPAVGSVVATGSKWEPYRLLDPGGGPVEPVAAFFADLLAAGRSVATVRSSGMDLLRWFRFLWSIQIRWDRATRVEARDFCRWLAVAGHGGGGYSVAVRAHSETVLRTFYDFHRDVGTGPMLNPFPLDRSRRGGRAHAHHNPREPYRGEKTGLYRPRPLRRIPRSIPDEVFNEIFARLPSNRDRALVAFYVSTGARASELLSATQGGVDPGRQLITDVQYVLGHAQLTTTQIYLTPRKEDVIARVLAHHADRVRRARQPAPPAPGYRPETLEVLFGRTTQ